MISYPSCLVGSLPRTYDFPSWLDYIADSLFLSVEAVPIECSDFDFFSEETADNFGAHCQHCHWCFTRWKDYVIPGFVAALLQVLGLFGMSPRP